MWKIKFCLSIYCIINCLSTTAQQATLAGTITDSKTKELLTGVTVWVNDSTGTSTDAVGHYNLSIGNGTYTVTYKLLGYVMQQHKVTLSAGLGVTKDIAMVSSISELSTVVVSASKFEQKLNEVVVSMNVVKPALLENNNHVNIENAMEQVPGVTIVDRQANIRGGSGFSYGAGSRVLMMVDEMPMLAADANDVKWSFLPIENVEQIEIIKGASSALFGSSALNGIINFRTAYPKSTPETKITFYAGMYDTPALREQRWWGKQEVLAVTGFNFLHSQQIKNLDIVIGGQVNNDDSYRQGDYEDRYRINTNLRYRLKKLPGFSFGINANYQRADGSTFFIWKDDSVNAFIPATNTVSVYNTQRMNVDPFITYVTPGFGTHKMKFRNFNTRNYNNTNQSSFANNNYFEYQYQQLFAQILTITAGVAYQTALIRGDLYARHTSNNTAFYLQTDLKYKRWNISLGGRMENNNMDTLTINYKPVLRSGINYEITKGTNIRASYGQGYRFPSIAERYVKTNVGIISVYPNDSLKTEYGWSAEVGIQQMYKMGKVNGYVDVAVFQMEYKDMMEFVYGIIKPPFQVGFQSRNIGNTRISGVDITLYTEGKILPKMPLNIFAGYTFIDPIKTNFDEAYDTIHNTSKENVLKYRNRHLLKFDFETGYGKLLVGTNVRYYSPIENIDKIFEAIIYGVESYREKHTQGDWVTDVRLIYQANSKVKIGAVVKNITNHFYVSRPANPMAGRFFSLQASFKF